MSCRLAQRHAVPCAQLQQQQREMIWQCARRQKRPWQVTNGNTPCATTALDTIGALLGAQNVYVAMRAVAAAARDDRGPGRRRRGVLPQRLREGHPQLLPDPAAVLGLQGARALQQQRRRPDSLTLTLLQSGCRLRETCRWTKFRHHPIPHPIPTPNLNPNSSLERRWRR